MTSKFEVSQTANVNSSSYAANKVSKRFDQDEDLEEIADDWNDMDHEVDDQIKMTSPISFTEKGSSQMTP